MTIISLILAAAISLDGIWDFRFEDFKLWSREDPNLTMSGVDGRIIGYPG